MSEVGAAGARRARQTRFKLVRRAPVLEARRHTQGRKLFDRLVRWAVLAKGEGIMGINKDVLDPHECRQANGVAGIVLKHQERARVGHEAAVQGDAVDCGSHAELAHAPVHVIAVREFSGDRASTVELRSVRA